MPDATERPDPPPPGMQIRCAGCGRAVPVEATGVLPARCPHCAGAPVPETLGRWRIERLLAAGGMGEVYVARHRQLGTRVALKLLPQAAAPADAARMRDRLAREAELTASIDHPGVVRVLDHEEDGGRAFLVLELVDGRSLRSLLRDGPLPIERALELAARVADVLAAAHAHGVVHRDVKPDNVLVTGDGAVRVLDFGIARALQDPEPLTRTGEILGTPEYMAPEQLLEAPESIDARTDVHALGVLTTELLTGTTPFRGGNLFQVLKLVESLEPGPVSARRRGVPPAVDAVLARALQKDRAARFADAAGFAAALRAAAPRAEHGDGTARRPRAAWAAAVVVAAATGFGLGRCAAPAPLDPPPAPQAAAPTPFERGTAALHAGAFVAALDALDDALRAGDVRAAEPAAVAWLGAHLLWPVAVDAPRWLAATDAARRARLFATGAEAVLPDTALARACRALADGDAAAAVAELQPDGGAPLAEPAATVALLAAHLACADRAVLRRTAAAWRPAEPGAGYLALEAALASPEILGSALRDQVAVLDVGGPDRWIVAMCAAYAACRDGGAGPERLWATAELAWLTGAGEVAPLWCAALRVDLASARSGLALSVDDAQRVARLLHGFDADEHPALPLLQALLQTAERPGEAVALAAPVGPWLAPFAGWARAAGPDERAVWHAVALRMLGRDVDATRRLADAGETSGAVLLRAAWDRGGSWSGALAAGPDLGLLAALRFRVVTPPTAAALADPSAGAVDADALLPAARALVRLGVDPDALLELDALRGFRAPPGRAAWIRAVQGGVDV